MTSTIHDPEYREEYERQIDTTIVKFGYGFATERSLVSRIFSAIQEKAAELDRLTTAGMTPKQERDNQKNPHGQVARHELEAELKDIREAIERINRDLDDNDTEFGHRVMAVLMGALEQYDLPDAPPDPFPEIPRRGVMETQSGRITNDGS